MFWFKKYNPADISVDGDGSLGCKLCSLVPSQGRSGERTVKFPEGKKITVEIVNESKVPSKGCFTLYIQDRPGAEWTEMPIRCCPLCGERLGGKKCQ